MHISVTIKGLEEFRSAIKRAPAAAAAELSKATQKSVLTIEGAAKREAPVNKQSGGGNLRQSIKSRMTGRLSGEIVAHAPYSAAVELGTRPHLITAVNKRVLANRRTGQFFGKVVHHPGTKPNPFFERAVRASISKINEYFKGASDAIVRVLK